MKKLFYVLMALCVALSLVACGTSTSDNSTAVAEDVTYTLGMGTDVSLDSSADSNAQVDATVAAVVLDADGKIVKCTIDAIQNKMDISSGTVDTAATFLTKMEKGDDYNMVAYSDSTIEWYDQAKNFAAYCVGKTADEVAATETTTRDSDGYTVVADADLYAQCSIQPVSFIAAVVKACQDDQAMTFTASSDAELNLGVGITSYVYGEKSADATSDADGAVCMESDYAAAVVVDGTIVADVCDAIQPVVNFSADGVVTGTTFSATKRELKEDYNMVKYNPSALAEWYQQAASFANYCVGKTAAEVSAIETTTREDDGYIVAADSELYAQCSIQITTMRDTVARAADLAVNPLH